MKLGIILIIILSGCGFKYEIPDSGMGPYFPNGTKVYIDTTFYINNKVNRLDIVYYKIVSQRNNIMDISRIIGLPSDTIIFTDSTVYINNRIVIQSKEVTLKWTTSKTNKYIYEYYGNDSILVDYDLNPIESYPNDTIIVPNNNVLVLSDQRYRRWNSLDEIVIPLDSLYGKVTGYAFW